MAWEYASSGEPPSIIGTGLDGGGEENEEDEEEEEEEEERLPVVTKAAA